MYEIFLKLLEEHNVTAYRVGKATGIGASTFSDWKNGRSEPKREKLQKIADYFGVSIEYLLTGKELSNTQSFINQKDERDIAIRLEGILKDLENPQENLMFSGKPLDSKTKELLKASLENSIRIAKINV